ncbi:MAG: hypothetical protein EBU49_13320, partial [Proteobacteria bacterium]|nr:hypothetical protein [Pseudomonadota bacterium]
GRIEVLGVVANDVCRGSGSQTGCGKGKNGGSLMPQSPFQVQFYVQDEVLSGLSFQLEKSSV